MKISAFASELAKWQRIWFSGNLRDTRQIWGYGKLSKNSKMIDQNSHERNR